MKRTATPGDSPRIAVVGPCGSGKTTLVERLRGAGYEAWVVGQEHSAVPDLWARRNPDVVIALDLDLATLRARRSPGWSADVFAQQHVRLRAAFAAADLIIDTAKHDIDEVVAMVLAMLEGWQPR